ncbi:MAG: hypothetical protein R2695_18940 [Acidimicrobiales bacterium]
MVDDRSIYRPGETVRVKGWVRSLPFGPEASIEMLPAGELITYVVHGAFGNEVDKGEVQLSETGGFDFATDLPRRQPRYGVGRLRPPVHPGRFGYRHEFAIEEFRRPEFEVTTRTQTEGPYFVNAYRPWRGGHLLLRRSVAGRAGRLDRRHRPGSYAPPGWDDYTFGIWQEWWIEDGFGPGRVEPETSTETFSGTTDEAGAHFLEMTFQGDGEAGPRASPLLRR